MSSLAGLRVSSSAWLACLAYLLLMTLVVSAQGGGKRKTVSEDVEPLNVTEPLINPNLTGDPQIDWQWDPNLPHELIGYDLSDYPFYKRVPKDGHNFTCDNRHDGFYASIPHKCQVYYNCLFGQRYDFLCANYTVFDQVNFICHYASEVDCKSSELYFDRNEELYVEPTTTTTTTPKPKIIFVERPAPLQPLRANRPRPRRPTVKRRKQQRPNASLQQKPSTPLPPPPSQDPQQALDYYDDYPLDYSQAGYDYYYDPLPPRTTTLPPAPVRRRPNRPRGQGGRRQGGGGGGGQRFGGGGRRRFRNRGGAQGGRRRRVKTTTTTQATPLYEYYDDYYYDDYAEYPEEPPTLSSRSQAPVQSTKRDPNKPLPLPVREEEVIEAPIEKPRTQVIKKVVRQRPANFRRPNFRRSSKLANDEEETTLIEEQETSNVNLDEVKESSTNAEQSSADDKSADTAPSAPAGNSRRSQSSGRRINRPILPTIKELPGEEAVSGSVSNRGAQRFSARRESGRTRGSLAQASVRDLDPLTEASLPRRTPVPVRVNLDQANIDSNNRNRGFIRRSRNVMKYHPFF